MHLIRDDRGLSTMEYAVLFVVILIGAIALWSELGSSLGQQLGEGQTTVRDYLTVGKDTP